MPARPPSSSYFHGSSNEALDRRLSRAKAVLLDLDGTLVTSFYDWQSIRRELEISGPSIIDSLNGLEGPEREARWNRMREIEKEATHAARAMPGTRELLAFLREKDLKTALVTNNSSENTVLLLDRFQLAFDLVLTRDDGSWKPSGTPLLEAMRRLDVTVDQCFLVGDSRFDLLAARAVGCPFLAVGSPENSNLKGSDRIFVDLGSLHGFLRELF